MHVNTIICGFTHRSEILQFSISGIERNNISFPVDVRVQRAQISPTETKNYLSPLFLYK